MIELVISNIFYKAYDNKLMDVFLIFATKKLIKLSELVLLFNYNLIIKSLIKIMTK